MSFRRSKCGVTFFFYVFKEKTGFFALHALHRLPSGVLGDHLQKPLAFPIFLYRKNKSLYKFSENVARFFYSFLLVVLLLPFIFFPFSEAL